MAHSGFDACNTFQRHGDRNLSAILLFHLFFQRHSVKVWEVRLLIAQSVPFLPKMWSLSTQCSPSAYSVLQSTPHAGKSTFWGARVCFSAVFLSLTWSERQGKLFHNLHEPFCALKPFTAKTPPFHRRIRLLNFGKDHHPLIAPHVSNECRNRRRIRRKSHLRPGTSW